MDDRHSSDNCISCYEAGRKDERENHENHACEVCCREGIRKGTAAEREEILETLPDFETINPDGSDIHFNEALRQIRILIRARSERGGQM